MLLQTFQLIMATNPSIISTGFPSLNFLLTAMCCAALSVATRELIKPQPFELQWLNKVGFLLLFVIAAFDFYPTVSIPVLMLFMPCRGSFFVHPYIHVRMLFVRICAWLEIPFGIAQLLNIPLDGFFALKLATTDPFAVFKRMRERFFSRFRAFMTLSALMIIVSWLNSTKKEHDNPLFAVFEHAGTEHLVGNLINLWIFAAFCDGCIDIDRCIAVAIISCGFYNVFIAPLRGFSCVLSAMYHDIDLFFYVPLAHTFFAPAPLQYNVMIHYFCFCVSYFLRIIDNRTLDYALCVLSFVSMLPFKSARYAKQVVFDNNQRAIVPYVGLPIEALLRPELSTTLAPTTMPSSWPLTDLDVSSHNHIMIDLPTNIKVGDDIHLSNVVASVSILCMFIMLFLFSKTRLRLRSSFGQFHVNTVPRYYLTRVGLNHLEFTVNQSPLNTERTFTYAYLTKACKVNNWAIYISYTDFDMPIRIHKTPNSRIDPYDYFSKYYVELGYSTTGPRFYTEHVLRHYTLWETFRLDHFCTVHASCAPLLPDVYVQLVIDEPLVREMHRRFCFECDATLQSFKYTQILELVDLRELQLVSRPSLSQHRRKVRSLYRRRLSYCPYPTIYDADYEFSVTGPDSNSVSVLSPEANLMAKTVAAFWQLYRSRSIADVLSIAMLYGVNESLSASKYLLGVLDAEAIDLVRRLDAAEGVMPPPQSSLVPEDSGTWVVCGPTPLDRGEADGNMFDLLKSSILLGVLSQEMCVSLSEIAPPGVAERVIRPLFNGGINAAIHEFKVFNRLASIIQYMRTGDMKHLDDITSKIVRFELEFHSLKLSYGEYGPCPAVVRQADDLLSRIRVYLTFCDPRERSELNRLYESVIQFSSVGDIKRRHQEYYTIYQDCLNNFNERGFSDANFVRVKDLSRSVDHACKTITDNSFTGFIRLRSDVQTLLTSMTHSKPGQHGFTLLLVGRERRGKTALSQEIAIQCVAAMQKVPPRDVVVGTWQMGVDYQTTLPAGTQALLIHDPDTSTDSKTKSDALRQLHSMTGGDPFEVPQAAIERKGQMCSAIATVVTSNNTDKWIFNSLNHETPVAGQARFMVRVSVVDKGEPVDGVQPVRYNIEAFTPPVNMASINYDKAPYSVHTTGMYAPFCGTDFTKEQLLVRVAALSRVQYQFNLERVQSERCYMCCFKPCCCAELNKLNQKLNGNKLNDSSHTTFSVTGPRDAPPTVPALQTHSAAPTNNEERAHASPVFNHIPYDTLLSMWNNGKLAVKEQSKPYIPLWLCCYFSSWWLFASVFICTFTFLILPEVLSILLWKYKQSYVLAHAYGLMTGVRFEPSLRLSQVYAKARTNKYLALLIGGGFAALFLLVYRSYTGDKNVAPDDKGFHVSGIVASTPGAPRPTPTKPLNPADYLVQVTMRALNSQDVPSDYEFLGYRHSRDTFIVSAHNIPSKDRIISITSPGLITSLQQTVHVEAEDAVVFGTTNFQPGGLSDYEFGVMKPGPAQYHTLRDGKHHTYDVMLLHRYSVCARTFIKGVEPRTLNGWLGKVSDVEIVGDCGGILVQDGKPVGTLHAQSDQDPSRGFFVPRSRDISLPLGHVRVPSTESFVVAGYNSGIEVRPHTYTERSAVKYPIAHDVGVFVGDCVMPFRRPSKTRGKYPFSEAAAKLLGKSVDDFRVTTGATRIVERDGLPYKLSLAEQYFTDRSEAYRNYLASNPPYDLGIDVPAVSDELYRRLRGNATLDVSRPCTFDEAINGRGSVGAVPRSTSAGFGLGKKSKYLVHDGQRFVADDWLRVKFDFINDRLIKGDDFPIIMLAIAKTDEVREISKNKGDRTINMMADFAQFLVIRAYLMPIINLLYTTRETSGIMIGINMHDHEQLHRCLCVLLGKPFDTPVSELLADSASFADISKYEAFHHPILNGIVNAVVLRLAKDLGYTPLELDILQRILGAMLCAGVIVMRDLIISGRINNSGHPWTSWHNTIFLICALLCALSMSKLPLADMSIIGFGDDNGHKFSHDRYEDVYRNLKLLGLQFVDPNDKTKFATVTPMSGFSFLKRSIVYRDGLLFAPLERKSVVQSLMLPRVQGMVLEPLSADARIVLEGTVRTAMIEAFIGQYHDVTELCLRIDAHYDLGLKTYCETLPDVYKAKGLTWEYVVL